MTKLPSIIPPSLCADVVFFLIEKKTPRDAYKILGRYLGVTPPHVVIDTEL